MTTSKKRTMKKKKSSTADFTELVHSAMRKQARGHSVGYAALELAKQWEVPVEHAHLISRAAEVHARLLRKEAPVRVTWLSGAMSALAPARRA